MRMRLSAAAAVVAAAVIPLAGLDDYWLNLMVLAAIYTIFALGLTVLFGYTDQVSFGQGGFFAIGAYVSVILALDHGWSVWLSAMAAVFVSCLVGYVVARPILRLSGLSLAMATLALGQMIYILAKQLDITGGPIGLAGIPAPSLASIDFTDPRNFYWLTLVIVVVAFVISKNLVTSNYGRQFRALGASDGAARSLGINVNSAKAFAFTFAAGLAGLAGALYAHYFSFISSDSFALDLSIMVVIMVVVGGRHSLWGAVVGAVLITFVIEYLHSYQEYSQFIYGALLIVIFMAAPDGLVGLVRKLRSKLAAGESLNPDKEAVR